MTKRLLLAVLAFAVCFSVADARRRTPKAGKIEDGKYVDAVHKFKLDLPKGWSVNIKDKEDPLRFTMTQDNFQIPPDYLDAEDYTTIPRLSALVVESEMSPRAFLDSLMSDSYESETKKEVMKHFEILHDFAMAEGTQREELVTMDRRSDYIGELRMVRWMGQSQYIKNVTLSASSQAGKRVYGAYAGSIVIVKNGDKMLLLHLMTEEMYHRPVLNEVWPMVENLEWERED